MTSQTLQTQKKKKKGLLVPLAIGQEFGLVSMRSSIHTVMPGRHDDSCGLCPVARNASWQIVDHSDLKRLVSLRSERISA